MLDAPPNAGNYDLILADPPWRYGFSRTNSRKVENHYTTMALEDICALPVGSWAADNCVLLLWTTAPKMMEAVAVVNAWGFEYVTQAVWDKRKIGMGYYFRGQHEPLWVCRKGKPIVPAPGSRVSSVMSFSRGKHSAKPPECYDIIERMWPATTKLEMFARNGREG